MKRENVVIHCTSEQAYIIEACLEIVSRIGCGQLGHIEEAISLVRRKALEVKLPDGDVAMCVKLANWIEDTLKPVLFPELHPNASYGIGSKQIPNGQIMYEMYKVLQNYRAEKDGHSKSSVTWNTPLKYSKEPLIRVVKVTLNTINREGER